MLQVGSSKPVGQMQAPLLHDPPLLQVTLSQGFFSHDVYRIVPVTAKNKKEVNSVGFQNFMSNDI